MLVACCRPIGRLRHLDWPSTSSVFALSDDHAIERTREFPFGEKAGLTVPFLTVLS